MILAAVSPFASNFINSTVRQFDRDTPPHSEEGEALAFCRGRNPTPPREAGHRAGVAARRETAPSQIGRVQTGVGNCIPCLGSCPQHYDARISEIKQLRWRDIDLMDRSLTIRRSKTLAGERLIPLNPQAYGAIMRLRERAQSLFGTDLQLDWHVFPSAEGYSKPDPTRPMSGWRSAWKSLTCAVSCPACGELQSPSQTCCNAECGADIKKVKKLPCRITFSRSSSPCHN